MMWWIPAYFWKGTCGDVFESIALAPLPVDVAILGDRMAESFLGKVNLAFQCQIISNRSNDAILAAWCVQLLAIEEADEINDTFARS